VVDIGLPDIDGCDVVRLTQGRLGDARARGATRGVATDVERSERDAN
jgi:hypothetical protein